MSLIEGPESPSPNPALDQAASNANALYPFKSGNLPRTRLGAMFTRSLFFMESCRDQMSLNWQNGGSHDTHMQWLNTFNRWRRQAVGAVERMETHLDKPHRRAKRFINRSKERSRGRRADVMNGLESGPGADFLQNSAP